MSKYHQGKFNPINKSKYDGDYTNIIYRSSWERYAFKWVDTNPQVLKWSSETSIISYYFDLDKKYHRYFIDLTIHWKDGTTTLVEIKPDHQTRPPVKPKRKTQGYIREGVAYVKNSNKWKAAEEYCKDRQWNFEIWTEHTLYAKGIMPKPKASKLKTLKPMKPFRKRKK